MSTSLDNNDIEEGLEFQPKFDASGLVTCVATDAVTSEVLMVAHMNDEALRRTIASGEAWYFSRSRNSLWRKGETSGHVQRVVEMRMDCDQDARGTAGSRRNESADPCRRLANVLLAGDICGVDDRLRLTAAE